MQEKKKARVACSPKDRRVCSTRYINLSSDHLCIFIFNMSGVPPQLRGRVWKALCGTDIPPVHYMSYPLTFFFIN